MTYKIKEDFIIDKRTLNKGYFTIGGRTMDKGYFDYIKEYKGYIGKLIENEIKNKPLNLDKKFKNKYAISVGLHKKISPFSASRKEREENQGVSI